MSTKNNTQRFVKVANRRDHYGIRKLTVGVASVLLGTTLWLGKNANVVHADNTNSEKDSSDQAESSDVKMPSVNENTQVRVETNQAASNGEQSAVSGDAQVANTQSTPQSSETEQKVTVPDAGEHAEEQVTVDSSNAKTQSTQTSTPATSANKQENRANTQVAAPANNQKQSTSAVATNKANNAGQINENKTANVPAAPIEKAPSIQSNLKQDKVETKSNNATQELKVNNLSSGLSGEELTANLTKGNQILVKQSTTDTNAVKVGKNVDPTKQLAALKASLVQVNANAADDNYTTVNDYDGLKNAVDDTNISGVNITGTINVGNDLNIDRAFTIKGAEPNAVLNLDSHKINNTGNLTLDDITVNGSVMGNGTVNIKGNVTSNVDDSNGYNLTRDERNEKGLETNWDQTKGNNIQANTVNVDDNASLTINRSSVGDGIHLANNGAVNVDDYGKLTINMNTNNDLDTTARYHDAGIFAEGNDTFTTGTKSVVTLNTSIGQGISMTGMRPNTTDDDRFGGYTAAQSRPGGSGQINLGRYSTMNLTGRDGVILGDNSNFNVGDYANVHFENKGRGVALDLANNANINIGDHAVTYFHSTGKTTRDARGNGVGSSGSYDGYNYIGVNEGGNITVGEGATFRVILQGRGDNAWDDVIQLDSRSTNTEVAFTSKKGAIVDLRDDNTNFYAELIGSMGNAKIHIDFDNPLLLNLQRYSTGGSTTGWSTVGGSTIGHTSSKYTADLFYIGGTQGTISIDGNNNTVYQHIKSNGSQQIWRNVNGLKVDQNGFTTKNIYDNGANSDLSIDGDGLVGGIPANQIRNNGTDPTTEGQNSPAYGISFMRADHQIWIPNEGKNQITGTHTNTIKYVYEDGTPVLDANDQPLVATQKYNLTRDVNTELTPEQIEALPDYALNHTADEVQNYIQKAGTVTQDSGWKITDDQGQTVTDPNVAVTSPIENGYTATVQSTNAPGVTVGANGSNIDAKLTMDPSKDVVQNGYLSAAYRNNGTTGIPDDYVTTVAYSRDNDAAQGSITYTDDTTGNVLDRASFNGAVGDKINYTTADRITYYENLGYDLVSNDFRDGNETFANEGNIFNVHLVHATAPINSENTYGRTDLTKNVSEIIHYVDESTGRSVTPDYTNTVTFTGQGRVDKVTGKMLKINSIENTQINYDNNVDDEIDISSAKLSDFAWSAPITFKAVTSPTVTGYTIDASKTTPADLADGNNIKAIQNVGYDHDNVEAIVYYVVNPEESHKAELTIYTNNQSVGTATVNGAGATPINFGNASDIVDNYISQGYKFDHAQDITNNKEMSGNSYSELNFGNFSNQNNSDQQFAIYLSRNVTPSQDQIAQVIYRDVNDPDSIAQIGTSGNIAGASGSQINYDPSTEITNFENRGYELKNNGFPQGAVFDNDDNTNQTFYIDFVHKTTTITPDNPGKPGDPINPNDLDPNGPKWPTGTDAQTLRRNGSQTVHYQYDDGTQAAPDNVQNTTFDHTLVFDNVTGQQIEDRDWNPESHKFNDVTSPTINGYTPNKTTVAGETVTPTDLTKEITVVYAKNGTRLVNPQMVTAMQTVRYVDDQGNELMSSSNQSFTFVYSGDTVDDQTNQVISRGRWNESSHKYDDVNAPVIIGYITNQRIYQGSTATPTDPNQNITIVYHNIGKIVPVDPNHNPIPDVSTPSYVNDSTDPTKVTPNEPVPNVPNMTPETPNVTPTDPTMDTPVIYSANPVNPDTPDQSRVSITFNDVDANAAQDSDAVKSQLTTPITLTGLNGSTIDLSQVTIPTNFLLNGDRPTDKKFGTDNAITLNVTHQRQDVSATDPNASTSVKRTIIVTNPNDGDHDMSQTLTLRRSAMKDLVTNSVDYGQWNNGQFGEVVVPTVEGYTPSQATIPAVQNVTADYVDPRIHVVYTANNSDESTQIISYVDVNDNKEVGQQVVRGKVGDTFHITPELPDGWERVKANPVNITISPNGKGTTIVVPVDALRITISPDQVTTDRSIWGTNDHAVENADVLPGTKAKYLKRDLNYGDLHTLVKRSILIKNPNGGLSKDSIIQTVEFKRSAIVNAITGEVENYTAWIPENDDKFEKKTVPVIDGYTASQSEVPELDNIKVDYQDPHILITYKGNPNQQIINYKDANGNIVAKQTVNGNNGQEITINSTIPDGYKLADNSEFVPKETKLEPNNKEINIVVTPIVSEIDSSQVTPDKPIKTTDVLSGTQNKHLKNDLTYNDLHKDVTRTVTVKLPDGTTLPTVQIVHFVRSANINKATGDVTYTKWTPEGDASLNKIDIPTIDGYSATQTVIDPIANVTDNYQDPKIEVTYKPSDSSQTINFVDDKGNVVGTQKISGTTNEVKDLTAQAPDGWQTATDNLPKQVRIKSSDTPISVYVVPKQVNIKPDEVTKDKAFTTNEVLPGTQNKHAKENINYSDLHKTVDRKINITLPDGTVKTVDQGVHFKRAASVNTATGDITFGNWSADGSDNLDKVDMPQVAGYIPAGDVWAINYLNEDEDPKDLKINYVADTPANRLAVAKQNMVAIQNAIQNLQTEISDKENALNKITSQHKANQKDLADKEKEVNDLLTPIEADAADEVKGDLQNDKSLEDALIKAKKSVSDVIDQINSENDSISSLKSRLADANNVMATYKKRKGDLSASIDQDQKLIDKLNAQITQAQKKLNDQITASNNGIKLDPKYIEWFKKYNAQLAKAYEDGYNDTNSSAYKETYQKLDQKYPSSIYSNAKDWKIKQAREASGKARVDKEIKDSASTFNTNMKQFGQSMMQKMQDNPIKFSLPNDKNKIVNLDNLTNEDASEINAEMNNYAFNLLNSVRSQLGLPLLKYNEETAKFAMDIAKRYQSDLWTHKHHDSTGVNDVAGKYGLLKDTDPKEQFYESLALWTARNSFGIAPSDQAGGELTVTPVPPKEPSERKDMLDHITDMDSIKQGIYADFVSMLMNDDWGSNFLSPWGHAKHLLSMGRPMDYTGENKNTRFAMSADVVHNIVEGKDASADSDGSYSQHFILVPDDTILDKKDPNNKFNKLEDNDPNQPTLIGGDPAQIKAAQDELNKYIEQRDALLKSLEQKKRELSDNDSNIDKKQDLINALQDAINQKQGKIDQLKGQLPDVQNKLKAAQDSLNKHNSDVQTKQKDVQQKVQDLQKAQVALSQLQDQMKKQDSQIADLTTKTDNLKKRKIEYDKVSDDIKQNVDHTTDKNNQQNQGGQDNQNTQNTQNNQNNGGQVQNNTNSNTNTNVNTSGATGNTSAAAPTTNTAAPQQETNTSAPVDTSNPSNDSDEDESDPDMDDENYSGTSKHAKSTNANEAPRAEVQRQANNAPKGMNASPVHGALAKQGYVRTGSSNLNNNHSESTLPQTGEDDDLAAIIAGDLAASLSMIGLVGLKKKKRE